MTLVPSVESASVFVVASKALTLLTLLAMSDPEYAVLRLFIIVVIWPPESFVGRDVPQNTATFGLKFDAFERFFPWNRRVPESVPAVISTVDPMAPVFVIMLGTASTQVVLPLWVFAARPP